MENKATYLLSSVEEEILRTLCRDGKTELSAFRAASGSEPTQAPLAATMTCEMSKHDQTEARNIESMTENFKMRSDKAPTKILVAQSWSFGMVLYHSFFWSLKANSKE